MSFDGSDTPWMHQALDALSDVFFVFNQNGNLLRWNEQLRTVTGYADAEIERMHVLDFFDADDKPRIRHAIRTAFAAGEDPVTARVVAKDGTRTPFEFTGSMLTADDEVVGICGIGRDISKRLQTEQSLAEAKKWLHSIFQNTGIGIAAINAASHRFVLVNPAMQKKLGYAAGEIERLTLDEITHPDDRPASRDACQAVLAHPTDTTRIEQRYLTKDGTVIWSRVTLSAVETDDGKRFVIGMFEDISDTRRYQRQRDDSRNRWQSLVDTHPAPVLLLEQEGQIVFANAAAARMLGAKTPTEILDRSVLDFVPKSDRAALTQCLFDDEVPAAAPHEHRIIDLDGRERSVATASSFVAYRGKPVVQAVIRDITPRKQYEHQLRSAKEQVETINSVQSAFLATMSHELRTPLTAILGFTDLLLDELDGETRAMAEQISTSSERLLATLNSILDLATLESGDADLDCQTLDVAAVLRKVLASFRPETDRKNLDLRLSIQDDEPVEVETDERALTSILRNLISNAVKFTNEGHIDITLEVEESELVFRIEDTGIGISPAFLPHIFDRFKQESEGLQREYEGTGIGLAVTKRLVQQLGGTIDVASEKSVGSAFTVRLPHAGLASPPASLSAEALDSTETEAPPPEERPTLLVLEDNAITLRLLERILGKQYHVETAPGAEAAIQKARSTAYDGLVFDINLSERRTGIEVLHEIRSLPQHESTPAVACTAYGLRQYEEAFLDAGFDAVVPKPVTKRSLLGKLAEALATPHKPHRPAPHDTSMEIDLPPLPTTVPEIAQLIAREDDTFNLEELTPILERDQIASMWLLQHINSAYYNLNVEVTSIDRAVVYVGFRPVCNLVLTEVLNKTYSDLDTPYAQAVYHYTMRTSLTAASFAKELALHLEFDRPEVIYSAGILCQIGRLLLLDQYGDTYAELWYDDEDPDTFVGPPPTGREILNGGVNYVQFGIRALRDSNVSHEILSLIRHHRRTAQVTAEDLKGPVLAIAVGLEAAETLFDPQADDTPDLSATLQQSSSLKALAALADRPADELSYVLYQNADRILSFVDHLLSQEDSLRAV